MEKAEWRTAAEILAERESDPEWVARRDARETQQAEIEERSIEEQAMLLADLRQIGHRIRWIWDFVNTADNYPDAIPVLIDHLRRGYADGTREGIARALTIKEARGIAGPAMTALLRDPSVTGAQLRWALANALTIVADRADREEIKALIAAEPAGDVQNRLKRALKTAAKP